MSSNVRHIKKVLFVCSGNTCRSVMAKGLFEKAWAEKPKSEVEIDSAGIGASPELIVPRGVKELMMEEGIDVSTHVPKALTDEMIYSSDIIFVMDNRHKEHILHRVPNTWEKVHLLKNFGRAEQRDSEINDPIGQPLEVYRKCFQTIKESIERVVKLI